MGRSSFPLWASSKREPVKLQRLIGDRAYDSDGLDEALADQGIEMITLHRRGRKKTHDGRKPRRYKRRWKIERLFAWLDNYRRLVVRYKRYAENFLGFVRLACVLIVLEVHRTEESRTRVRVTYRFGPRAGAGSSPELAGHGGSHVAVLGCW
jgi:transposase